MLEFPTYIQIEKQMAISLEMIKESKGIVVSTLIEHFDAKPSELIMFGRALTSDEDWTCGFADELLPLFLEVRNELNNMCKTCEDITLYPDEQCTDCKKIG